MSVMDNISFIVDTRSRRSTIIHVEDPVIDEIQKARVRRISLSVWIGLIANKMANFIEYHFHLFTY